MTLVMMVMEEVVLCLMVMEEVVEEVQLVICVCLAIIWGPGELLDFYIFDTLADISLYLITGIDILADFYIFYYR